MSENRVPSGSQDDPIFTRSIPAKSGSTKKPPSRSGGGKKPLSNSSTLKTVPATQQRFPWWAWLILVAMALAFVFVMWGPKATTPTIATAPAPAYVTPTTVISNFPLAGNRYLGYVGGRQNALYDAVWTSDGRLWQPDLPPKANRVTHTVAIELVSGYTYVFNGVESVLNVDTNCDKKTDYISANKEDGKTFSIPSSAGVVKNGVRVVWATIWSSTPSGGTEIVAVGPAN